MRSTNISRVNFTLSEAAFDRFLRKYWFAPQDVLLRATEASLFNQHKFKHPILDVGIGDAEIPEIFYPRNLVIDVGCDIDPVSISRARKSKKYRKVVVENAEKLSFPKGKFATIICNSTAEHITKDALAIKEFGRVLKKGGELFLTVPSEYLPKMILELERFEGNPAPKEAVKRFNARLEHKHYHGLDDWNRILNAGGLRIIAYRYYFPESTTLFWYRWMRRAITPVFGRELWSWIGHSRLTSLLPKPLIKSWLRQSTLHQTFTQTLLTPRDEGGMLFILAQKK